jgi:DNA polymerase III delta prime subunit
MYRDDHTIWVEKYRPRKVDDCVLPKHIKNVFKGILRDGNIPNMLLSGPAGSGKTTVAKALCHELEYEFLFLNASKDRGIDVIRHDVVQFASAKSLDSKRKAIIFDEADYLTPEAQTALRGTIEEFAGNCCFIFTCNYKNKIIDALKSRTSIIEFRINKESKKDVLTSLYKRITYILDQESITYNKEVLPRVIVKYFPDFRRIINELQSYSRASGAIDEGILSVENELDMQFLYSGLKNKKFQDVRQWVVSALDNDQTVIYNKLYQSFYDNLDKSSIPQAIVLLADYQYKSAFSADPEPCLLACLVELMVECKFQ